MLGSEMAANTHTFVTSVLSVCRGDAYLKNVAILTLFEKDHVTWKSFNLLPIVHVHIT